MKFQNQLIIQAQQIGIKLTEKQAQQFCKYKDLILEWNRLINLTAITEEQEIASKHFIDSIECYKYIKEESKLIDVGTGAGFPGIPLKICFEDRIKVTFVDSLKKRIDFLNKVISELELKGVETIHSRAEDLGQNFLYREKYDCATSRAVAKLNVLAEYCLPFVKIGGIMLSMKGGQLQTEEQEAKKAIEILGGEIEQHEIFKLPNTDINRSIIKIKKTKTTPKKYPRKAGKPRTSPIK